MMYITAAQDHRLCIQDLWQRSLQQRSPERPIIRYCSTLCLCGAGVMDGSNNDFVLKLSLTYKRREWIIKLFKEQLRVV